FTEKAAVSTRDALRIYGLEGLVIQADAQKLPLKTGSIDRVYSMGVLHHLPDTNLGLAEAHRVLKPGGSALISLYGKLFFFNPVLFPVASFFLKRMLKAPPQRNGIQHTSDYDEFYRLMDGPTNPIGRWYTDAQLRDILGRFEIHSCVTSHFPLRYLKLGGVSLNRITPRFIKKLLDRRLGMMRNFQLSKAQS
ncbi:MAG: class I SAM-dependent methyltransferase, partial [Deltaproteobacteria bacterium]|nr:class I SAM-dependent methyltransferase [Deltaproteobacteria bacterium]